MELFDILYPLGVFFFAWIWAWSFTHFIDQRLVKAKIKNGFPPKVCLRCNREFEWRKKWARDWENVKYCSDRCRSGK